MAKQIQDAYIVAAKRTPVGKAPRGMFRNVRPDDLLAHTLKARYWLHVAERLGQSAYQNALTEAQQGIQQGEDFLGVAGDSPVSNNLWYQFTVIQRSGYVFAVNPTGARFDGRREAAGAPRRAAQSARKLARKASSRSRSASVVGTLTEARSAPTA